MTRTATLAALATENPPIMCATNQKNTPLSMSEKSPNVMRLIGSAR